jgi:hypothetical protein
VERVTDLASESSRVIDNLVHALSRGVAVFPPSARKSLGPISGKLTDQLTRFIGQLYTQIARAVRVRSAPRATRPDLPTATVQR